MPCKITKFEMSFLRKSHQCGSYRGLAILQCKNLNFPYYYGVLQCKKREGVEEEMYEEVDEEEPLQVVVDRKASYRT